MSKKISQMTPTGSAPATSELAIAYNGANYKITPQNLVDSTSSGGGGAFTNGSVFRVADKGFTGNGGAVGTLPSVHACLNIQGDGSAGIAGVPVSPDLKYSIVAMEFTRQFNYLNASNVNGYMPGGGVHRTDFVDDNNLGKPKFWINSGLIPTYHRASNMVRAWLQRGLEISDGVYALIYDNQLYFAQEYHIGNASNDYYTSYGNYIVAVTN
jgi:hypothetical protein